LASCGFNELSEHAAFIKVTVGDSRAAGYLRRHFALSHLIPQPPALPPHDQVIVSIDEPARQLTWHCHVS